MNAPEVKLKRELQSLSIRSKSTLSKKLIRSIDEPTPEELEKLWIEEAVSRIEAAENGLVKLIPYEEIKRKVAQRAWR